MKLKKSIKMFVLSVILTIGCICFMSNNTGVFSVYAASVTASGKCGDNSKWSLSNTGTLTISGKGSIYNYSSPSKVPWNKYNEKITKIEIKKNITRIGNYSFWGLSEVDKITIPSTVTAIGAHAFEACQISELTLPSGLKTIGQEALSRMEKLKAIHIPASVTSIGKDAFMRNQKMTKITVATSNKNFSAKENVLYNKSKTKLILVGFGKTSFTVPTSVKTIANGAFNYHKNIKTIVISKNVTSLPAKAFYECASLESVTINGKITDIKEDTFSVSRKLKKLVLPATLKNISGNAFKECYSLKTLKVHSDNKNFVVYNNMLLNKKKTILYLYLPMGKETLTLPTSLTTIKDGAFKIGYLGLKTLKFQGHAPKIEGSSLGTYHDITIKYPIGATGYKKSPWTTSWTEYTFKTYNKKVTITFNGNSGVIKTSSKTVTDGKYGTLPVPTRKGYVFQGWYTAKSGGTKIISTTTLKKFTNHTLYAHWKKK